MALKKLKPDQYHALCHCLQAKAYAEPLDASYTVKMQVNSMEYAVQIQPEEECCFAALQALLIEREDDGPSFEQITESPLLASLLELLVFQGMRQAL